MSIVAGCASTLGGGVMGLMQMIMACIMMIMSAMAIKR